MRNHFIHAVAYLMDKHLAVSSDGFIAKALKQMHERVPRLGISRTKEVCDEFFG